MREHKHWDDEKDPKKKRGLFAGTLNKSLDLKGTVSLIEDYPPCFFAGRIGSSKKLLLSLNPGYNEKRNIKEKEVYEDLGWEKTYRTFFEWFYQKGLSSQYYSRFAVFLSGFLGETDCYPKLKKDRYELLDRNLVNLDLIPYHSISFTNKVLKPSPDAASVLNDYIENLRLLIYKANPEVIFINGSIFGNLLPSFGIIESKRLPDIPVNLRLNRNLMAHLGSMRIEDKTFKTVRFENFISGKSLAATNDGLFSAGRKIADLI